MFPTGTWTVSRLETSDEELTDVGYASPLRDNGTRCSFTRTPTDPHFEVCRNREQTLYEHCKERTGQLRGGYAESAGSPICLSMAFPTRKTPQTPMSQLAQLARAVALSPSVLCIKAWSNSAQEIGKFTMKAKGILVAGFGQRGFSGSILAASELGTVFERKAET